jgi:secondary thiamine-phosphate synthase enzyme
VVFPWSQSRKGTGQSAAILAGIIAVSFRSQLIPVCNAVKAAKSPLFSLYLGASSRKLYNPPAPASWMQAGPPLRRGIATLAAHRLQKNSMHDVTLTTRRREEFIRLDDHLESLAAAYGWRDGLLLLHVPHTTAALTINENGDPDVPRDLLMRLAVLAQDSGYRHAEGNSDAHLKSSLLGCQLWVPLKDGRLRLGTWQSVWFCEFDGPRQRQIWVRHMEDFGVQRG